MNQRVRQSTGIPGLDPLLGGGLLPGTLTVVVGATGIGKSQFGVQFAAAGGEQDGRRGIFFDMNARGDAQNQDEYARRMFDWSLTRVDPGVKPQLNTLFSPDRDHGDYLHVFDYHGRRVTRRDLEWEQWKEWQAELNTKLSRAIEYVYGNLCAGVRRVVIDGIEPVGRPSDSIQLNLFEYIYHQVIHKDPEWVARDLFREKYRVNAEAIAEHTYDTKQVGCLLLYTSHEAMLEDLISRPLDEGDLLSGANTLIYFGKIREGVRISKAMYIAKHRGSACTDEIIPYTIDDNGISVA